MVGAAEMRGVKAAMAAASVEMTPTTVEMAPTTVEMAPTTVEMATASVATASVTAAAAAQRGAGQRGRQNNNGNPGNELCHGTLVAPPLQNWRHRKRRRYEAKVPLPAIKPCLGHE
jgi:hypothetical protein